MQVLSKLSVVALLTGSIMSHSAQADTQTIRIATFNVSMEALNYVPYERGVEPNVSGTELYQALTNEHQQIKNIAEIIQRVNPDIILLNEFDHTDNAHKNVQLFMENFLEKPQQGQKPISFSYFFQGDVNTGVASNHDLNHDGIKGKLPEDGYGFGYFSGHFGMLLLSKYPIEGDGIRTFQHFKWQDMPNALQVVDPKTKQAWYDAATMKDFRLSSKSHWDIPVNINGETLHVLASHPTPPVFDGDEDRNGKRNHDEIRFWHDYIYPEKSGYIYDDDKTFGGIKPNSRFVILGDQNASKDEGSAIRSGIGALLADAKVQDPQPQSNGASHSDSAFAKYHTAHWGMRADYVLPSSLGMQIVNSGIFWPTPEQETYRLVKDRQASSDHRLVWVDVEISPIASKKK